MIVVIGESIKTGLIAEIKKAFPGAVVYKEQIRTEPIFPHFFIELLTLDISEERQGFYWLNSFITIRYREGADIQLVNNLHLKLDDVAFRMLTDMTRISFSGVLANITGARTEKVEGDLHYFCNIRIQLTRQWIAHIKQMTLEQRRIG